MAEPTLIEIFGAGATQTATSITILKADLPTLTPTASNTAESLLAGILIQAKATLSVANRDSNPNQSIAIDSGYDSLSYRGTTPYYQSALNVTLQKVNQSASIDADDY